MGRISAILTVVLLSMALTIESSAGTRRGLPKLRCLVQSFNTFSQCFTCNPFQPREVTIVIRNVLREPYFEVAVVLECTSTKTLLFMLQEAAEINEKFRFTATYFNFELGYYIEAINDVFENFSVDGSFWEILDGNLQRTPVGASNYEPADGETVTFNLTLTAHEEADESK